MSTTEDPADEKRTPDDHPGERDGDKGRMARLRRTLIRENWYRDVWLVAITIIVLVSANTTKQNSETSAETSKQAKEQSEATAMLAESNTAIVNALDAESRRRTRQFCGLIVGAQQDREDQLAQTKVYLASEAGQEDTGINETIRKVLLPQLKRQVKTGRQNLPPFCKSLRANP